MVPSILKEAKIDEVFITNEISTIEMCHELLREHCLFLGGSSGSVYSAVKKYFKGKLFNKRQNVVAIFVDSGDRYINTIYNDNWCDNFLKEKL